MMTGPLRFLIRMVAFLAVVVVAAAVLFEPIRIAFAANPGLNGLILGVLVLGAAHCFRRVLMLNGEIAWIESMQRRRTSVAVPPRPRMLSTVAAAIGGERTDERVRLNAITMRSLLDGISDRLSESGEISRYVTGLVIFLGLLGTFWGLLETVASVGQTIDSLDIGGEPASVFASLKAGLEAPLGGMGTAFSSSLFGLASALVLGFLDLQAGQAQNRFFNELEEWLSSITRLGTSGFAPEGDASVPAYIHALLEHTAEALDDLRRITGRAEESRVASNQSLKTLAERLGTLTQQMQAEQSLLVRLAEQQIALQPVMQRIAENTETAAMIDPESRQHLHNVDYNLSVLVEQAETGRAELLRELRNEIKLLARTISMLRDDRAE